MPCFNTIHNCRRADGLDGDAGRGTMGRKPFNHEAMYARIMGGNEKDLFGKIGPMQPLLIGQAMMPG